MTQAQELFAKFVSHDSQYNKFCKNCGVKIEWTTGKAYTGWVHRNGHHTCGVVMALAEPTVKVGQ